MHYYAFYHRYGINMRNTRGDVIGTLHVFSSRKARDAWVSDDRFLDGNPHRTPFGYHGARRILVEMVALADSEFPEIVSFMYSTDALIARIAEEIERGTLYSVKIHEEAPYEH